MLSEKRRFRTPTLSDQGQLRRSADQRAVRDGVELVERGELVISHPGKLAGAAAVWMGGTFAVCYLLLPLARAGLGLSAQSLSSIAAVAACSALALVGLWMATTLGLLIRKPTVHLDADHRDRALTATTGGLLVWAVLHNTLPGLIPFGEMGTAGLLSFLGANIIENALFGVMIASVAKTVSGAFKLGLLFQGALLLSSYAVLLSI